MTLALQAWFRRLTDWAAGRALAPGSLFGISLLLALCATAWFSGGTGSDNLWGTLALCGWSLARVSGRRLAAGTAGPVGRSESAVSRTAVDRSAGARSAGWRPAGWRPAAVPSAGWRSAGWRPAAPRSAAPRSAGSPVAASPAADSEVAGGGVASFVSTVFGLAGSRRQARGPEFSRPLAGTTDWLVLPGAIWDDDADRLADSPRQPSADRQDHGARVRGTDAASSSRLAEVCTAAAECAIYGGIAAGGQSAGWTDMWPLAVMAVIAVAVRGTIGACRSPGASAEHARLGTEVGDWHHPRSAAVRRAIGAVLAPAAGTRVLIAAVVLAVHGPRLALFVILTVQLVSICCAVAGAARRTGSRRTAARTDDSLVVSRDLAAPPEAAPARQDVVLASRDDGAVARWAGRLVQGNLLPLRPALAAVAALVMLTVLGLKNLPGVIALTPVAVMMLAAPGSSHPHDRRFDWLTPVLLQVGQYIYLAALGFASGVPGPVSYALCALTAVWYASLAAGAGGSAAKRQDREAASSSASAGTLIGWEGRMLAICLGTMLGAATFAYLALAAYLGVLIGRGVTAGRLMPLEDDRR